ncbi:YolD-like family protein [Virgibacillus sp. C22-A2]|uniref:YolD-like family protein n=1 Tax=Virgibacillus tibetensis TaxID=3042313 RepID=A0ABU6KGJ7_9BACI|nr:YolD-like family protein [Virgibacillus sp. C22-A2]
MVNDRGNIKWTAMMMPEHINLLNQMWEEKEYKEKPLLDEQHMYEINMKLHLAISNNLNVFIEYYKDHDFHEINGKLKMIDSTQKYLQLDDENPTEILMENILDVHID